MCRNKQATPNKAVVGRSFLGCRCRCRCGGGFGYLGRPRLAPASPRVFKGRQMGTYNGRAIMRGSTYVIARANIFSCLRHVRNRAICSCVFDAKLLLVTLDFLLPANLVQRAKLLLVTLHFLLPENQVQREIHKNGRGGVAESACTLSVCTPRFSWLSWPLTSSLTSSSDGNRNQSFFNTDSSSTFNFFSTYRLSTCLPQSKKKNSTTTAGILYRRSSSSVSVRHNDTHTRRCIRQTHCYITTRPPQPLNNNAPSVPTESLVQLEQPATHGKQLVCRWEIRQTWAKRSPSSHQPWHC